MSDAGSWSPLFFVLALIGTPLLFPANVALLIWIGYGNKTTSPVVNKAARILGFILVWAAAYYIMESYLTFRSFGD